MKPHPHHLFPAKLSGADAKRAKAHFAKRFSPGDSPPATVTQLADVVPAKEPVENVVGVVPVRNVPQADKIRALEEQQRDLQRHVRRKARQERAAK